MTGRSEARQLERRSEVFRWRIGCAVIVLVGALGTWVFGGAWFFAGMWVGYLACMWVAFADPDRPLTPKTGDDQ